MLTRTAGIFPGWVGGLGDRVATLWMRLDGVEMLINIEELVALDDEVMVKVDPEAGDAEIFIPVPSGNSASKFISCLCAMPSSSSSSCSSPSCSSTELSPRNLFRCWAGPWSS